MDNETFDRNTLTTKHLKKIITVLRDKKWSDTEIIEFLLEVFKE